MLGKLFVGQIGSLIVLSYIASDNGRFQRFVSNRVAYIRSKNNPEQWRYLLSIENPADVLSRGVCDVSAFVSMTNWIEGPNFLKFEEHSRPSHTLGEVGSDDHELVKKYLATIAVTSEVSCSFDLKCIEA